MARLLDIAIGLNASKNFIIEMEANRNSKCSQHTQVCLSKSPRIFMQMSMRSSSPYHVILILCTLMHQLLDLDLKIGNIDKQDIDSLFATIVYGLGY